MLKKCPECLHDVSTAALSCPSCGFPLRSRQTLADTLLGRWRLVEGEKLRDAFVASTTRRKLEHVDLQFKATDTPPAGGQMTATLFWEPGQTEGFPISHSDFPWHVFGEDGKEVLLDLGPNDAWRLLATRHEWNRIYAYAECYANIYVVPPPWKVRPEHLIGCPVMLERLR